MQNSKKKEICPICHLTIKKENCWVKYHISYSPEKTIMACKYCNFTEYFLRHKLDFKYHKELLLRKDWIIQFSKKFDIIYI